MASPTETVARNFLSYGVYDIILFAVFAAVMYAVLRKSKILGDSPVIAGIVSLGAGFMFFGYPVITGNPSLLISMTTFFTQASILGIVFLVAFLMASFFYPDMVGILAKTFTHRTTLMVMVSVGFILFITSGLVQILWQPIVGSGGQSNTGTAGTSSGGVAKTGPNVLLLVAGIAIFMMMIIIAAAIARSD
ncbi:MAG TPA: hypothetical protein VJH34_02620 [archaeon]|nr:hypothetical protein [archaeon]